MNANVLSRSSINLIFIIIRYILLNISKVVFQRSSAKNGSLKNYAKFREKTNKFWSKINFVGRNEIAYNLDGSSVRVVTTQRNYPFS